MFAGVLDCNIEVLLVSRFTVAEQRLDLSSSRVLLRHRAPSGQAVIGVHSTVWGRQAEGSQEERSFGWVK